MTRAILLLCVCICASVRPGFAQCPDGTPPPCRGARTAAVAAPVVENWFEELTQKLGKR